MKRLNQLNDGEECKIVRIENADLKKYLYSLGIGEGTKIKRQRASLLKSPIMYFAKGTSLALRYCDSELIEVEPI